MNKLVLLCILATAPSSVTSQVAGPILIQGVRVFDGHRVTRKADVLIEGGRIVRVAPRLRAPAAEKVDGSGKTLLPGLIDSHVHGFPGAAGDALRFGVTTEVEMFSMMGKEGLAVLERQRETYARTVAADIWSAGVGVTPPQGVIAKSAPSGAFPTLSKDASAEEFVAARAAEGADHVKIFYDDGSWNGARAARYERFTPEQLQQIIAAAHRHKLKAIVHTGGLIESQTAIEKGADGLAHVFRGSAGKSLARLAKKKRSFVIPTFSAIAGASASGDGTAIANDVRIGAYLSPSQKETLKTEPKAAEDPMVLRQAIATVGMLHAAGVPIIAGTDAPNPGTAHGAAMPIELSYLVRSGLTPAEALTAATSLPARKWGMSDRGRIAPGYRADLLLVDGNPTKNIGSIRNISAVWKNGFLVDRTVPAQDSRGPAGGVTP
jgi:imidazolonepropionase-like amidohydrolase